MNKNEKLFNSFRLAKGDILKNEQHINDLHEIVDELQEQLQMLRADHRILMGMVYPTAKKEKKLDINNQHIVPREDGWAVVSANAKKATRVFKKKKEAVEFGTKRAEKGKVCAVIHNKDGTFKTRDCR